MSDRFYNRLDFYRLLEAGMDDIRKASETLGIHRGTLWRWKKAYDPERGPFLIKADKNVGPPMNSSSREEIIAAVRQAAMEGNIPAAKLLLAEYEGISPDGEDFLTVDRAVELLREWTQKG